MTRAAARHTYPRISTTGCIALRLASAAKFQVLVDVLNEVRDEARRESDIDLLRTYDIWLKTGSARARRLLRQKGVVPISDAKSRERH